MVRFIFKFVSSKFTNFHYLIRYCKADKEAISSTNDSSTTVVRRNATDRVVIPRNNRFDAVLFCDISATGRGSSSICHS